MKANILLVEDDPEFASYLKRGLIYEGYQAQIVSSAEEGLALLRIRQPDLVVLDLMLPGIDGIAACRVLRQSNCQVPVLMLTARNSVHDRVTGLNAGADDYLGKPFAFDELLARVRALLRRRNESDLIRFADLELDTNLHVARRRTRAVPLSRTEYDLLALFMTHPKQVLIRDAIIEQVWQDSFNGRANGLDVYVSRLRHKLGDPPLIHTVYGVGYILKEDVG